MDNRIEEFRTMAKTMVVAMDHELSYWKEGHIEGTGCTRDWWS